MNKYTLRIYILIATLGILAILGFANIDPLGDAARAEAIRIENDRTQKINNIELEQLEADAQRDEEYKETVHNNAIAEENAAAHRNQTINNTIVLFLEKMQQSFATLFSAVEIGILILIFCLVGLAILWLGNISKPFLRRLFEPVEKTETQPEKAASVQPDPWSNTSYRKQMRVQAQENETIARTMQINDDVKIKEFTSAYKSAAKNEVPGDFSNLSNASD